MATAASQSDLSSDDSDDDFLTTAVHQQLDGNANPPIDREALVRKKLLENFYGKSAVAATNPTEGADAAAPGNSTTRRLLGDSEDDDDDDDDDGIGLHHRGQRKHHQSRSTEDLDSIHFDAVSYKQRRVCGAPVHDLLEQEEYLALQVRTLDSTMQTLVYENYNRFIDATDAIKSIGINVQANQGGLDTLVSAIQSVEDRSRTIDEALGTLREQVAEKIRVKRLLTRLDTLLKLPTTLREQIAAGKYRSATKSYLTAVSILGRHSEGFESLKTIESECTHILSEMKKQLQQKLHYWSGRQLELSVDDADSVPDPPKTMLEIFECAGTLLMLLDSHLDRRREREEEGHTDDDNTVEDFMSMSTTAATRFLERTLDTHMIEVQERRFADVSPMDPSSTALEEAHTVESNKLQKKGVALVAQGFLNALLEAATLYSMTFQDIENRLATVVLHEFVAESFSSFLHHTKSILLEESAMNGKEEPTGSEPEDGGSGHQEVAGALSILVRAVRELSSSLVLPEVGIRADLASRLVQQASSLTDSMVRRRVDQKFHTLRHSIATDCLLPFVTRVASEPITDESMVNILQWANSVISDCLQLIDDSIRSIVASGMEMINTGSAADQPDLKDVLQYSSKRLAFWLANALEILAGGEAQDRVVYAPWKTSENDFAGRHDERLFLDVKVADSAYHDDSLLDKLDSARELIASNEGIEAVMLLAIAEMCRTAVSSVAENLQQSIAIHLGSSRKKASGLFPSGEETSKRKGLNSDHDISLRFQLAQCSILVFFACMRGSQAGMLLCSHLVSLSEGQQPANDPGESALKALEVAKQTSIDYARVFGGSKRAGPVTELDTGRMTGITALASRKTGLFLDVERIFKERIPIFPHPFEPLDLSRDGVMFLFFKVAFRTMAEQARQLWFSEPAYQQLMTTTEFLRQMSSHYVSNDYHPGGNVVASVALSNLLDDLTDVLGDQCQNRNIVELKDDMMEYALRTVRSFLTDMKDSDTGKRFIIDSD